MKTRTTWLICSLLAIPGAEALAADNLWVGTWTLDPGKSHLTGDTFSFSKGPGSLLHYADGSVEYDFGIDGKDYRSLANRTVSWSTAGQSAWEAVHKIEGKVHTREHHELSADGRTLSISTAGTWPDGSTFHNESVYQRVTGTDGLVGTWRSVKATSGGPPHFIISSPAPGVLRYELPDSQQSVEGRADGSDHPINGPTAPPGFTSGFKLVSPTKLTYVLKVDGKPIGYGVQTLAPDGRTFTDVSWNPGKESEKLTSVYLKQ